MRNTRVQSLLAAITMLAAFAFVAGGCSSSAHDDSASSADKSFSGDDKGQISSHAGAIGGAFAGAPATGSIPASLKDSERDAADQGLSTAKKAGQADNAAPITFPSRQVIRQAQLDVRVEKVEKAEKTVNSIVQESGGYVDSASSSDLSSDHPTMQISLRVPVTRFESVISKFEGLGVRLSKSINSQDVTGHIVDLDARIKTLSIQAEDYRNMLKNRTQLTDVFTIRNQLADVQNQLEDISAQRKSQAGLAALSTINLTLEQNGVISQAPTDPNWFTQAWAGATSGAAGALRIVMIGLMWIAAFSPFWIPIGLLLRRLGRTVRRPGDAV